MTRLIDQRIEVLATVGNLGVPDRFRWRERWHSVHQLLDFWTEAGAWWDGERETTVFRVLLDGGLICELVRTAGGIWRLYRLYD